DCQMGSIVVNGLRIHDHHPYAGLTVSQILEHSSDVGAIKIALRLGEERFDRYIRAFGFGTQTRIELPGETRGITKPVSRWSKVSIGAISMGQEIGVSPVQLASMVSTIANDGLYVPPRIVAGTTAPRSTPQLIAFHPAVTVLVVLDSPAGGYPKDGGGEAAAPVFARIAQQVLAYMNVPHDVELQDPRRMWLRAHTKEDEVYEAAPDYIASEQEHGETPGPQVQVPMAPSPAPQDPRLRTVAAAGKSTPAASSTVSAP